MTLMTANAAPSTLTIARTLARPLLALTSHLVLDNDTGRVVGVQHSLQGQGRHFATATMPVVA